MTQFNANTQGQQQQRQAGPDLSGLLVESGGIPVTLPNGQTVQINPNLQTKLKVLGDERDESLLNLVSERQKVVSGDHRLQEAADMQKKLGAAAEFRQHLSAAVTEQNPERARVLFRALGLDESAIERLAEAVVEPEFEPLPSMATKAEGDQQQVEAKLPAQYEQVINNLGTIMPKLVEMTEAYETSKQNVQKRNEHTQIQRIVDSDMGLARMLTETHKENPQAQQRIRTLVDDAVARRTAAGQNRDLAIREALEEVKGTMGMFGTATSETEESRPVSSDGHHFSLSEALGGLGNAERTAGSSHQPVQLKVERKSVLDGDYNENFVMRIAQQAKKDGVALD